MALLDRWLGIGPHARGREEPRKKERSLCSSSRAKEKVGVGEGSSTPSQISMTYKERETREGDNKSLCVGEEGGWGGGGAWGGS